MKKSTKFLLAATGVMTAVSCVVLPIGFININNYNQQVASNVTLNSNQVNTDQQSNTSNNNIQIINPNPVNPNLKNPTFCDGWIIAVTVIITVNVSLIITLIVILLVYLFKKRRKFVVDLSDF